MARHRLRFHSTEIDLPPGEVVIGRALECFIRLDDAMVSRRHASVHSSDKAVTVKDLGSRNGVTVNGKRISGTVTLRPGDRIGVGHAEFVVLGSEAAQINVTMSGRLDGAPCASCGAYIPLELKTCSRCGRPVAGSVSPTQTDVGAKLDDGAQAVLTAVGDKALALGRLEEAERILGGSLRDIQARITRGQRPDTAQVEPAMQRALKLARETRRAEWFRWIFDVAAELGMVLPNGIIDELHMLMFQHKPDVGETVDAYLTRISRPPLSAEAKFQLKRVAALRRFCP